MNALLIFLAVVVISAIIGGLAQMLKNVQKAEETRAARHRARAREQQSGSGDIDRFLEEIDKLRRKGGMEPPVARPVAAPAAPARPATRIVDRPPLTKTFPPARVEDLPVAPVVTPAPRVARRATSRAPAAPKSEFGRGLVALLGSKHALPTAVVLQEILGPPRFRRM